MTNRVDLDLFSRAHSDAIFLHCLPAHRGEEVTADVLEHDRSRIIPQAANRMHLQKALLFWLLGDPKISDNGRTPSQRPGLATPT